jgi:hypothetical protein
MIGLDSSVEAELKDRGWSDEDIAREASPRGDLIYVHYDRGDGSLTSKLPLSKLPYYFGTKGWRAVKLAADPQQPSDQPVTVPPDIQEHARHDRTALWERYRGGARDTMNASCKHAAKMTGSGWSFVEVCCPERLRDLAEARIPAAAATTPEPIINQPPGEARRRDKKSHNK